MLDEKQIILDGSLIAPNDFENVPGSMSRLLFRTVPETQLAPHIPPPEDIDEFGSTGKYSTQRQASPKLVNISSGEVDKFSQLLVDAVDVLVEVTTEHKFLAGLTEDSYSEFREARDKLSNVMDSIDNLIKAYEETNIMTAQNRAIDVDYTYAYAEWEAAMQLPARGPELSYDYDDTAQVTEDMHTMTDPDDAAADAEWEAAMQLPARGPELSYDYDDTAQTVNSHVVRRV